MRYTYCDQLVYDTAQSKPDTRKYTPEDIEAYLRSKKFKDVTNDYILNDLDYDYFYEYEEPASVYNIHDEYDDEEYIIHSIGIYMQVCFNDLGDGKFEFFADISFDDSHADTSAYKDNAYSYAFDDELTSFHDLKMVVNNCLELMQRSYEDDEDATAWEQMKNDSWRY